MEHKWIVPSLEEVPTQFPGKSIKKKPITIHIIMIKNPDEVNKDRDLTLLEVKKGGKRLLVLQALFEGQNHVAIESNGEQPNGQYLNNAAWCLFTISDP